MRIGGNGCHDQKRCSTIALYSAAFDSDKIFLLTLLPVCKHPTHKLVSSLPNFKFQAVKDLGSKDLGSKDLGSSLHDLGSHDLGSNLDYYNKRNGVEIARFVFVF